MDTINEVKLGGIIHKLYWLKTKKDDAMTKVLLQVGRDTFWVLAYGNVAGAIRRLDEGDELSIVGTAQKVKGNTEALRVK